MFPELAQELWSRERSLVAGERGPEGLHERRRAGPRDAEEPLDVAPREQVAVQGLELADGVGDGEEPPGRGGHRGGRVGYNPCGECELGRCLAHTACSRLVDGRLLVKIRSGGGRGGGEGPIKGVMGRRDRRRTQRRHRGPRRAHWAAGRPAPAHRWPPRQTRASCPGAGRSRASRPRSRAAASWAVFGVGVAVSVTSFK